MICNDQDFTHNHCTGEEVLSSAITSGYLTVAFNLLLSRICRHSMRKSVIVKTIDIEILMIYTCSAPPLPFPNMKKWFLECLLFVRMCDLLAPELLVGFYEYLKFICLLIIAW